MRIIAAAVVLAALLPQVAAAQEEATYEVRLEYSGV